MEDPEVTATGVQLARRLNGLMGKLLAGTLHVTTAAVVTRSLDFIAGKDRRNEALRRAVALLDGGQGLSRWELAKRLELALQRFEAVGYRRVVDGARPPTELETHLIVLLESGPRCASKLWIEIRDLPRTG